MQGNRYAIRKLGRIVTAMIFALGFYSAPSHAVSLEDIWNKLVDTAEDAGNAADRTIGVKGKVTTMFNVVDQGVSDVENLLDTIESAVEQGKFILEHEYSGLEGFVGPDGPDGCSSACESFRLELVNFLRNMETIGNILFDIQGNPVLGDLYTFGPMIDLVNAMPGYSLYPLHRAFTVDGSPFDSGFFDVFNDMIGVLEKVRDGLNNNSSASALRTTALPSASASVISVFECNTILLNPAEYEAYVYYLNAVSLAVIGVGKLILMAGTTRLHGNVGVSGWVGTSIKSNWVKKLGIFVDGLGTLARSVGSYAHNKMRYCLMVQSQEEMRSNQENILALLGLIMSRQEAATQDLPWNRRGGGSR